MSREYTEDEIREKFLKHVHGIIRYWLNESRTPDTKEKMEGAVFSILVLLDGGSCGSPGFKVIANPHPDDKEYLIGEGENYYPDPKDEVDIAGCLHELFGKYRSEASHIVDE